MSDVAADLEQRLAGQDLPLEYHAEVLQNSTAEEVNFGRAIGFADRRGGGRVPAVPGGVPELATGRASPSGPAAQPGRRAGRRPASPSSNCRWDPLLGLLAVLGLAARMSTTMVSTLQAAPAVERWRAGAVRAGADLHRGHRPAHVALRDLGQPPPAWRSCIRSPSSCSVVCSPPPWSPCSCCPASIGTRARTRCRARSANPKAATPRRECGVSRPTPSPAGRWPCASGWPAVAASFALAGCNEIEPAPTSSYHPAELSSPGPQGVRQVTFTDDAARRVGLQTSRVTAERPRSGDPVRRADL